MAKSPITQPSFVAVIDGHADHQENHDDDDESLVVNDSILSLLNTQDPSDDDGEQHQPSQQSQQALINFSSILTPLSSLLQELPTTDHDFDEENDDEEQQVENPPPVPPAKLTLILLSIQRFSVDQRFFSLFYSILSEQQQPQQDQQAQEQELNLSKLSIAYDLIVSDGRRVMKMTLNPKWNSEVMNGELSCGSVIQIKRYHIVLDELVIGGGTGIVLVDELDRFTTADHSQQSALNEFCLRIRSSLQSEIEQLLLEPQVTNRHYYLPMWDDDNFDEEIVSGGAEESDDEQHGRTRCRASVPILTPELQDSMEIDCEYLSSIAPGSLAAEAMRRGNKCTKQNVIGRVHKKTQLNLWRDESNAFPFSFMLLLVDETLSTGVPVIIWNRFALDYYHDINVGDVLLIMNFDLKPISDSDRFFLSAPAPASTITTTTTSNQPNFVKISVNPHRTTLYKVENALPEFAPLDYRVSSIREMHALSDGTLINIAGVIVRLSMVLRERVHVEGNDTSWMTKAGNSSAASNRPRFAQYRYVTIVDQSMKYVHCKLYTNSRKGVIDGLKVGQVIVLTDMLISSACPSSWTSQREFILQSTFMTSIATGNQYSALYTQETRDHIDLLQLFVEEKRNEFSLLVQHEYEFYALPQLRVATFSLYQQLFPKYKLDYFNHMFDIADSIQHREARTIAIQARVISISRTVTKKRKMKTKTKRRSKRQRLNETDPITQSMSDEEEAEDVYEEDHDGKEVNPSTASFTLLVTDMNKTRTVEFELNLWRLNNFRTISSATVEQTSTLGESQSQYTGSDFTSLCKFFGLPLDMPLPASDGDNDVVDQLSTISGALKDQIFICCVQIVKLTEDVQYWLSQVYPVK